MGTGVQCVLQRMHNMTAESASGALHSEREMCYKLRNDVNSVTVKFRVCSVLRSSFACVRC